MTIIPLRVKLISDWAFQWKISFNPHPNKQAQEIIFSRKRMKSSHSSAYFNNIAISSTSVQKHLGMLLHDKLSYEHYLKFVLNKVKNTIGLLRKFQQILSRQSLITIYKSFIRPHLDYGDTVYDHVDIYVMIEPLMSHFTKILNLLNITQP